VKKETLSLLLSKSNPSTVRFKYLVHLRVEC
jgi:hypothetical protein